ncbi:nuclear condensing complex subunit [Limtongia smithiae]|uniref:nuclear condensing complex subunit n=1 Tax=Limtongia smithiae TaxID=1125753 RepID=UPI0034CFDE26
MPSAASTLTPDAVLRHAFNEAQRSATAHRKLAVKVFSAFKQCIQRDEQLEFQTVFAGLLNRVLPLKKGEVASERVIKFVTHLVGYMSTQIADAATGKGENSDGMDVDDASDEEAEDVSPEADAVGNFVEFLLQHLLQGVDAKNKAVRYHVVQLLASLVQFLGDIDEDLFKELRAAFARRQHDKETAVRVQAVLGLSRLQGTDDENEAEPISELLLTSMQHDSKAEVRRTTMYNIEKRRETIPYVLERARDTDTATRRAVHSRILAEIGDFRLLSIGMREKILSWGLQDRDDSVRMATIRAFANGWLESTGNDVLELLERLDVMNSKIAETAMKALFKHRQDIVKNMQFSDTMWANLTAETAFLARAFVAYCKDAGLDDLLDDSVPELTKIGFHIQRVAEQRNNPATDEEEDEDIIEREFILEQLLIIAGSMDFSDETGRRKMFDVIRSILAQEQLAESVTKHAVVVLRKVLSRERDFCQVISEIVSDLHDGVVEDEEEDNEEADRSNDSFHSARSSLAASESSRRGPSRRSSGAVASADKAVREIKVNLKCLHLAQCMLEIVEGALKSNLTLVGMLDTLIVPAVRSHEAPVRERGLRCLGLCCLLDKDLAVENVVLFMHCFAKGHEDLQVEAVHIVCDMLMCHGHTILDGSSSSSSDAIDSEIVTRMLINGLRMTDSPHVQTASAEALSKLLLARILVDDAGEGLLVQEMENAYLAPDAAENNALRQTLSYCLPVLAERAAETAKVASAAAGVEEKEMERS